MERLMELEACAGVFSRSAVNNVELKGIQTVHEESHVVCELIRRNDTR